MKILRLFTIILILMNSTMLLGQEADYEMKLNDVRALAGELIEVELEITNEGEFHAVGLDVPLPAGFTFVEESFQLNDRSAGHVSSAVVVTGNILRILVFHQEETTAFLGEEGIIATFHLQTPEAPGTYKLDIVDGVLSDADAVSLLPLVTVPGIVTLVGNEIRILNTDVIINQDVTIDIEIENYQSFTAFQASIVLPTGFTYVEESAVLNTERAVENDHELQVSLSGNVLTIYSYSMTTTLFEGNSGIVVSFVLNAAPALGDGTPRDFPLAFLDAVISDADAKDILTAAHDGVVTVYDHNIISVLDAAALTNEIITIDIDIDNSLPFSAFEADIMLPEGFVYQEDSFVLNDDRAGDHIFTATLIDDVLRIVVYSLTSDLFSGWEGIVASFDVKLPNDPGVYHMVIDQAIISSADATDILTGMVDGVITVDVEIILSLIDTEVCSDVPVMVDINLANSQTVTAFETEVLIPDGFEYVEGSAILNDDRADDHIISESFDEDSGLLTLIVYSLTSAIFEGTNGVVASFELIAPIVAETTAFDIELHNTVVSNPDAVDILTETLDAAITVFPLAVAEITVDGDLEFCDGGFVVLTANESAEYLWSTGETTQSIIVETSGTYYVTITDDNGCIDTSEEIEVTVWPLPVTEIVPDGDIEFCDGGFVVLTAETYEDHEVDIVEYLWSTGEETMSIVVEESGTFTVTVVDANGCTYTSEPLEVVVWELPVSEITYDGELESCYSDPIELTATTHEDHEAEIVSYLWSNGMTTQSIVVSEPGTYTFYVIVTDANGCEYTTEEVEVTIWEEPVVGFTFKDLADTGDVFEYCYDETVTVTLSHIWGGLAPFDIEWTVNGVTHSKEGVELDGELFNDILEAGEYVVQITAIVDANGCSPADYTPYTATAVVHPEPVLGFTFKDLADTGDVFEYCYDEAVSVTLSHIWGGEAPFDIEWTVNGVTHSKEGVDLDGELFNDILEAGEYVVQITAIVDANGCSPLDYTPYTATAIVHPEPEAIITADGDLEFCDGGAVVLTVSESATYLWSNGETTQSITVTESGTFTVTVTDENGCSATSDEVVVTVHELPVAEITADGELTFCEGGAVVLTATEAAEYLWSNDATTQSITVTESGSFSVMITDANGCSATSDEVTVTVHALPTVSCPGNMQARLWGDEAFALTGATPEGGTYSGRGVSDGQFNPYTAGVGTHVITYTYTDGNGCTNTCTFEIEVINDTSVPGIAEPSIRVYPNPARSILNIAVENQQINEIRMIDMLGQIVYTSSVQNDSHEINVSAFKSGIYFVQVITTEGIVTQRVQVTR